MPPKKAPAKKPSSPKKGGAKGGAKKEEAVVKDEEDEGDDSSELSDDSSDLSSGSEEEEDDDEEEEDEDEEDEEDEEEDDFDAEIAAPTPPAAAAAAAAAEAGDPEPAAEPEPEAEKVKEVDPELARKAAEHVREEMARARGQRGAAQRWRTKVANGDGFSIKEHLRAMRSKQEEKVAALSAVGEDAGGEDVENKAPSEDESQGTAAQCRRLGISKTEIKEMKEVFDLIDGDKSGEISFDEMRELMRVVGMDADPERVQVIMDEVDADGSGTVDFEEFAAIMQRPTISKYNVSEIKSAFETIQAELGDPSNPPPPGHLGAETLANAFRNFGVNKLDAAAAQDVCNGLGPDPDGFINYSLVLRLIDDSVTL